jgi:hypothetical protein
MHKNAQCDFRQTRATKNVVKSIWGFANKEKCMGVDFTDNEKRIEVSLAFDDGGKMLLGRI